MTAAAFAFGAATAHANSESLCLLETASQAAGDLQSQGYYVQFNGSTGDDLSRCSVTHVDGYSPSPSGTVYLTVDCHNSSAA